VTVTTHWWWLRHAPVPGPEGRIHGRFDWPADTGDRGAFAALAKQLPKNPVVISSGLLRAQQTLDGLQRSGLELAPAEIARDLAEQDFGRWDGRTWTELEKEDNRILKVFWADPAGTAPPNGESFASMVTRVRAAILRLGQAHAGRDMLLVAHAGTIRSALAVALRANPETVLNFEIAPLALVRIDQSDGAWRVVTPGFRA
jgi:alpha-ribazole phosphatase